MDSRLKDYIMCCHLNYKMPLIFVAPNPKCHTSEIVAIQLDVVSIVEFMCEFSSTVQQQIKQAAHFSSMRQIAIIVPGCPLELVPVYKPSIVSSTADLYMLKKIS